MNDQDLAKLIKAFYAHCKKNHTIFLYDYQREICEKFLKAVFQRTGEEIFVEISRQAGKTEAIVSCVEFILLFYKAHFGVPIRIGIFAPQKEQAKTDFTRLKAKLTESGIEGWQAVIDPEESNAVTLQLSNGSFCYIFPLTPTSHPESKTLDLIIYEESNKIPNEEKEVKSDPMGTATNAVRIAVGVAGYQSNFFKKGVDRGVNVIKCDYKRVMADRRKAYEQDGNPEHLYYENYVTREIEEKGLENDAFRTQYGLEWILGVGQFITREMIDEMKKPIGHIKKSSIPVVVGIDTAKNPDRTIVTVKNIKPIIEHYQDDRTGVTKERVIRPKSIMAWLRLQGDNYEDQFYAIKSFLANFTNIQVVCIDSTGQGDFMPDMFENHTDYQIVRVKFSLQSKDILYKNLLQVVVNKATAIPAEDCLELREFEAELLDLQKEYKGEYLSCHHPKNDPKARDDYCDSWALAEYGEMWLNSNSADVHVFETPIKPRSQAEDIDDDDDDD